MILYIFFKINILFWLMLSMARRSIINVDKINGKIWKLSRNHCRTSCNKNNSLLSRCFYAIIKIIDVQNWGKLFQSSIITINRPSLHHLWLNTNSNMTVSLAVEPLYSAATNWTISLNRPFGRIVPNFTPLCQSITFNSDVINNLLR